MKKIILFSILSFYVSLQATDHLSSRNQLETKRNANRITDEHLSLIPKQDELGNVAKKQKTEKEQLADALAILYMLDAEGQKYQNIVFEYIQERRTNRELLPPSYNVPTSKLVELSHPDFFVLSPSGHLKRIKGKSLISDVSTQVSTFAASRDGNWIGLCKDKDIEIFSVLAGECRFVWRGAHSDAITSVSMSADGQKIVTAAPGSINVWDTANDKRMTKNFISSSERVVISEDGNYWLMGSDDGHVHVWDTKTGERVKSIQHHSRKIHSLCSVPNSSLVLSADANSVCLWNYETAECLYKNEVANACARISNDGSKIVTVTHDTRKEDIGGWYRSYSYNLVISDRFSKHESRYRSDGLLKDLWVSNDADKLIAITLDARIYPSHITDPALFKFNCFLDFVVHGAGDVENTIREGLRKAKEPKKEDKRCVIQ